MVLPWNVTVQICLHIPCSLLQVAWSWATHSMAGQPYMAVTHMQISVLTQTGPWDIGGSEIHADPQYVAAQQASIERLCVRHVLDNTTFDHSMYPCVSCSYHAESVYHRQTSQHSVDGEDVTTTDPPSLRNEVQKIHKSC